MTDRQTCGALGGMEAGHLNVELLEDSEDGKKMTTQHTRLLKKFFSVTSMHLELLSSFPVVRRAQRTAIYRKISMAREPITSISKGGGVHHNLIDNFVSVFFHKSILNSVTTDEQSLPTKFENRLGALEATRSEYCVGKNEAQRNRL